jgi:hypothetical protein
MSPKVNTTETLPRETGSGAGATRPAQAGPVSTTQDDLGLRVKGQGEQAMDKGELFVVPVDEWPDLARAIEQAKALFTGCRSSSGELTAIEAISPTLPPEGRTGRAAGLPPSVSASVRRT